MVFFIGDRLPRRRDKISSSRYAPCTSALLRSSNIFVALSCLTPGFCPPSQTVASSMFILQCQPLVCQGMTTGILGIVITVTLLICAGEGDNEARTRDVRASGSLTKPSIYTGEKI